MNKIILYAPNVHTGGGLVLLKALLACWPEETRKCALLDQRLLNMLSLPKSCDISWVKPTLRSRLKAELAMRKITSSGDTVLCFHGLPPLFPVQGRVVLFFQNRDLLGLNSLFDLARLISVKIAISIALQRFFSRLFYYRVHEYIVQTPTMARDLTKWLPKPRRSNLPTIHILPFMGPLSILSSGDIASNDWDFLYVSSGEPHKNHLRLLEAWSILAKEGLKPTLALTLGPSNNKLIKAVEKLRNDEGVLVYNLKTMERDQLLELFTKSKALIFPSLGESFGLPLIEAQQLNLPILAPELDYVRDVCTPVQTFDPLSSLSIVRAVKRFLGQHDSNITPYSAEEFWSMLGIFTEKS